LRLHALHGLPHGKEATEVAQRLRVCEARSRIAARLQALVPGQWKAFYAEPGLPWPAEGTPIELLSDGTVKGRSDGYWAGNEDVLIVGGKRGASDEWANAGRLAPNGNFFEGLTLGNARTKYVKQ